MDPLTLRAQLEAWLAMTPKREPWNWNVRLSEDWQLFLIDLDMTNNDSIVLWIYYRDPQLDWWDKVLHRTIPADLDQIWRQIEEAMAQRAGTRLTKEDGT